MLTNDTLGSARHATANKNLLGRDDIAWPTLALFTAALGTFAASTACALVGWLPLPAAAVLNTLAAFAAFTPAHDAAHKSVGRAAWLNETVGRLSAVLLVAPFTALRYMHLEHHKHTNDPKTDPDHYSGRGPAWQLPLRWLSQDLHYYVRYMKAFRSRPRAERRETVAAFFVLWGVVALLAHSGLAYEVLLLWVVPARLAVGLLAFTFDYLPHRPHDITAKQDRYRATLVFEERWLTPFFFGQNYHLVHHLFPGVPFYRYGVVWRAKREALIAKGAQPQRLFGGSARPSNAIPARRGGAASQPYPPMSVSNAS